MGKLTISMAMFNSYVKLPEGKDSGEITNKYLAQWPEGKSTGNPTLRHPDTLILVLDCTHHILTGLTCLVDCLPLKIAKFVTPQLQVDF